MHACDKRWVDLERGLGSNRAWGEHRLQPWTDYNLKKQCRPITAPQRLHNEASRVPSLVLLIASGSIAE